MAASSSDLVLSEDFPARFPEAHAVLRQGLAEGVAPGFVAGVWSANDPGRAWVTALGSRRIQPSAQPMRTDTVFDLASVTKIYATATLAAVLVERGWLDYDAPVAAFFPDYANAAIRVRHLLSHTAGFAAWAPFWEKARERSAPRGVEKVAVSERQRWVREWVLAEKPEVPVGTRALYSDISFLLLGFILEEVTQMPLDRAVRRFVWTPMGCMNSRYFRVTATASRARDERTAATEDSPWRGGVLQGQVHDDNTWAMGGYAGHAGAFADARDLLHFSRRLLSGFLSPKTLARMWSPVAESAIPAGSSARTLGWDLPSPGESMLGGLMSRRSVGHWGFTGTSLWINPDDRFAVTLLSNRVHPSRENTRIKSLRPRFHDALMRDLTSGALLRENSR